MNKFYHLGKLKFRLSHVSIVKDVEFDERCYNELTDSDEPTYGFWTQFSGYECNFWSGYKTEAEAVAVHANLMEALENAE